MNRKNEDGKRRILDEILELYSASLDAELEPREMERLRVLRNSHPEAEEEIRRFGATVTAARSVGTDAAPTGFASEVMRGIARHAIERKPSVRVVTVRRILVAASSIAAVWLLAVVVPRITREGPWPASAPREREEQAVFDAEAPTESLDGEGRSSPVPPEEARKARPETRTGAADAGEPLERLRTLGYLGAGDAGQGDRPEPEGYALPADETMGRLPQMEANGKRREVEGGEEKGDRDSEAIDAGFDPAVAKKGAGIPPPRTAAPEAGLREDRLDRELADDSAAAGSDTLVGGAGTEVRDLVLEYDPARTGEREILARLAEFTASAPVPGRMRARAYLPVFRLKGAPDAGAAKDKTLEDGLLSRVAGDAVDRSVRVEGYWTVRIPEESLPDVMEGLGKLQVEARPILRLVEESREKTRESASATPPTAPTGARGGGGANAPAAPGAEASGAARVRIQRRVDAERPGGGSETVAGRRVTPIRTLRIFLVAKGAETLGAPSSSEKKSDGGRRDDR